MKDLAVAAALATSPATAFAELRERPRFWLPLLAVVATTAILIVWYYSVVDIDWLKEAMFSNNPDIQKMPAEQRAAAMNFVGRNTMLVGGLVGAIMAIPFFFLVSAVYYLLAAKVTKVTTVPLGLKHWFSFVAWTALPALLGFVTAVLFLLLRDNDQIAPGVLQPLSLNELFFHRPLGSKGQAFLDALQIQSFLSWGLSVIGIRAWTQRSWLYSVVVVFIPVVVVFGIWALFAFR